MRLRKAADGISLIFYYGVHFDARHFLYLGERRELFKRSLCGVGLIP